MNITVEKIKRTLEKDYGWIMINRINELLIKETLEIINNELIKQKGISIKKK